jgi:hypothetical protein
METNENANKPKQGTWDEMTPSGDRKPKVEFELNKSVELSFAQNFVAPREYNSTESKGVYYLFDCVQDGEEKVFLTAAWSLLQGLKNLEPLAGKNILIKKDMKDGKQHYSVEEVPEEEIVTEKPGK